jgi:hypothetical protein
MKKFLYSRRLKTVGMARGENKDLGTFVPVSF